MHSCMPSWSLSLRCLCGAQLLSAFLFPPWPRVSEYALVHQHISPTPRATCSHRVIIVTFTLIHSQWQNLVRQRFDKRKVNGVIALTAAAHEHTHLVCLPDCLLERIHPTSTHTHTHTHTRTHTRTHTHTHTHTHATQHLITLNHHRARVLSPPAVQGATWQGHHK
jgi:hypothetical protein